MTLISQVALTKHLHAFQGSLFPGMVLALADAKNLVVSATGNLNSDTQFFIASATKLYTTALILQLIDDKKLKLSDHIARFFDPMQMEGLHRYKGVAYSEQITIEHLLSHTSGLPDYFRDIKKTKPSLLKSILNGQDKKWDLTQVLTETKLIGAEFPPAYKNKAHYSDTNFQLLGEIILRLTGQSLSSNIETKICKKIGLTKTYLYQDITDTRPVALNYKNKALKIPLAMTSFGADGGVVSTAVEGILFLQGFFSGQLFNQSHISYLTSSWRNIFFPFKYGVGISLFRLPRYFSPFKTFPDLIGHSGLSGSFLFYCPAKELYFSGTVNQIDKPQTSFRLMLGLL